jgi:hypothetical protein
MSHEVSEGLLRQLIQPTENAAACVSIYLPTHKNHVAGRQDSIRFKNLARTAVERLHQAEGTAADEIARIEQQLASLSEDAEFWRHRTAGMAWLSRAGTTWVLDLPRPVPEVVVVADSLHIKPLIRITQSADRYHVLALTRHSAKMYVGTRDHLQEVEIAEIPATIEEALGSELTEPHLGAASYGGTRQTMFHGHGSKDAEVDKDRDRYFRAVAAAVERCWSNPTSLPLVLVALAEHHHDYQRISNDRFLLPQSVAKDPSSMSVDQLREATWECVRQSFDRQLSEYIERLGDAQSSQKGSVVVSDVAREAAQGRVDLLLLEADASLPGRLDVASGDIQAVEPGQTDVDDVLDDLAELVIARGGKVRILHAGSLQTPAGMGAIYRY